MLIFVIRYHFVMFAPMAYPAIHLIGLSTTAMRPVEKFTIVILYHLQHLASPILITESLF